jgi:signal peptidase I
VFLNIYIIAILLWLTLILFVLILHAFLLITIVQSRSMSPALESGDKVLILRRWYRPLLRKGRIVLVYSNMITDQESDVIEQTPYIKRLVALPGEIYQFSGDSQAQSTLQIPEGYVFVLGDYNASYDSRHWGPIPLQNIIGVAIAVFPRRTKYT